MNKLIKFIRKFKKDFKEASFKDRVLTIIGVIMFILFIVIIPFTIFIWGFLINSVISKFFDEIVIPLGFNFKKPIIYYGFFILFTVLIYSIYWLIQSRGGNIKIKINSYLIASIFIIGFLIIFGLCFINQNYKTDIPLNISWQVSNITEWSNFQKNSNCTISFLECKSSQNKDSFVIGDRIYCVYTVNENCTYKLDKMNVVTMYIKNTSQNSQEVSVNSFQGYYNFLLEEDLNDIFFYPLFYKNSSRPPQIYAVISLNNKYSASDYNQKKSKEKYEKTFLLITLISISLFSTIVAMNNLKQLLEKKE